jgi:propanol-preferring alcohol dehydrogenase
MRAIELFSPDPDPHAALRTVERPVPEPGPGQVRLRVTASAVCRTDLQLTTGELPAHLLPVVPGHQVVGVIDALGSGVTDWSPGDRAGLVWLARTCGDCRFCRAGRENLCLHAEFTGWDVDGGYAGAVVAEADFAHRLDHLPTDLPDTAVAPLLCGGVIGYRSLKVAGVGPDAAGMRVGLFGFGASATIALQVARYWGAEVYVVTRSEAEVRRATALGATWAGTYEQALPTVLDAAVTFAPAGAVVAQALACCDRGAAVAINAIHLDEIPALDYDDLWWERSLRSVANVTRSDVHEFLQLVSPAAITTQYEELPLADAATAQQRVASGQVAGAFVLLP